jgi:hypothetical protein
VPTICHLLVLQVLTGTPTPPELVLHVLCGALNCNILLLQVLQGDTDLLHLNAHFVADCPTIVTRVSKTCNKFVVRSVPKMREVCGAGCPKTVTNVWCRVSKNLTGSVAECPNNVTNLWCSVSENLKASGEGCPNNVTNLWCSVSESMASLLYRVSESMTSLWCRVSESMNSLWCRVSESMTSLWCKVSESMTSCGAGCPEV